MRFWFKLSLHSFIPCSYLHANIKFRKFVEMFHWYVASGWLAWLAFLVCHQYLETVRGRELLRLGCFKRDVGHHKSKEYEDGIYCFVVGPGVCDRQAVSLVFCARMNTKSRKPAEMFHWNVASGFAKQHQLQQVMLARVRDIGLRVDCAQRQLHLSACAGSVSLQLSDEWLGCFFADGDEPDAPVLPGHDHLCDIAADDVPAGDVGDFDFHSWTCVVLPTMRVHNLGVGRRDGDGGYETFQYAMHYVNVCVPFPSFLSDDISYSDELMAWLASLVYHEYLETVRGRELPRLGSFQRDVGHHKSNCFVVGPGVSDRQAATSVFYSRTNNKFRQPAEMLYWYVASVFAKQHQLQEVVLARVRDIGLGVDCVQMQLHLSLCVVSVSLQLSDEWLGCLSADGVEPDAPLLSGHDQLCDVAADDVAAVDVGGFDFYSWTCDVLPTMSVHILGLDRRDGDGGYETFECAMHYVNVCVPVFKFFVG